MTALEKIGSFLVSLEGRASATMGEVGLPFSRYDMADYLGLSVETVCRSITDLRRRSIIALADHIRGGGRLSLLANRRPEQDPRPPERASAQGWTP
jgi:CRP-like cAMP-binding protein